MSTCEALVLFVLLPLPSSLFDAGQPRGYKTLVQGLSSVWQASFYTDSSVWLSTAPVHLWLVARRGDLFTLCNIVTPRLPDGNHPTVHCSLLTFITHIINNTAPHHTTPQN